MNHLHPLEDLANRYFIMRHGQSLANQQRIIVSHPANGVGGYGLTASGRDQVRASLWRDRHLDAETLIVSSDFERARETASIAHTELRCRHAVVLEPSLRERHFGDFELSADSAYDAVWQRDAGDADSRYGGVESANQVLARMTALIGKLEQAVSARSLLLVSHGDALQILQCGFMRRDACAHRHLPHLNTAEIRPLMLAARQG